MNHSKKLRCKPGKTNTTAIVIMIAKNSARANSVVHENGPEFLGNVSSEPIALRTDLRTDSVMFLGKFET